MELKSLLGRRLYALPKFVVLIAAAAIVIAYVLPSLWNARSEMDVHYEQLHIQVETEKEAPK